MKQSAITQKGRDSHVAITEQDILNQIKEIEVEQKEARGLVTFHKRAAIDAETRLIAANLKAESLKEQLRVHRITTPRHEETDQDRDLIRFRSKLPELLKIIEEQDAKNKK